MEAGFGACGRAFVGSLVTPAGGGEGGSAVKRGECAGEKLRENAQLRVTLGGGGSCRQGRIGWGKGRSSCERGMKKTTKKTDEGKKRERFKGNLTPKKKTQT